MIIYIENCFKVIQSLFLIFKSILEYYCFNKATHDSPR